MIQHSPFDSVAKEYDDLYEEQLITKELRPLIRKSLIDYLKPGDHILELNCGTGTDAIAFAQEGINVMATDLSEVMLETSSRKVGERHLENRITFRQVDFNSFSPATFNNARFDGVFSNFDGLNCSPNIAHVLDAIADCLKPRGTVVMCVLNKVCIWEIATFLLRGNVKSAFRRFNKGTQIATVGDSTVPVWYFTISQLTGIMGARFEIIDIYGVNIFSPTLNSIRFVQNHPQLTKSLLTLDSPLCRISPFRGLGDHFVICARKR